jgi:hypothetical protein
MDGRQDSRANLTCSATGLPVARLADVNPHYFTAALFLVHLAQTERVYLSYGLARCCSNCCNTPVHGAWLKPGAC